MTGRTVRKVAIFGNSGSGKSTLARRLSESEGLAHLDLDTLAWLPEAPPRRRSLDESNRDILAFVEASEGWVVEGCYADLMETVLEHATEVVFMALGVEDCQANARRRPWEPHKYPSKEAQDANLQMLLEWIAGYETRTDTFSRAAHQQLYDEFAGPKRVIRTNS